MTRSPVVALGPRRTVTVTTLVFLLGTALSSSACNPRKARWNYGPLEDPRPESSHLSTERVTFDADAMERLVVDQGCPACHTFHGERLVGPPLDRLGGAERRFADGTSQLVDEAYLVDSLLDPSRKIVAGYDDVMPSYAERIDEAEAEMLAAYLASLR